MQIEINIGGRINFSLRKSFGNVFILMPIALILICSNIFSQKENLVFEQISLQQGLSQSIVTKIIQDKAGFMWFATEDGLNKYDGYEFKVFKNDPDNTNSLSYNQVTAIHEDGSGIIWIGTFYGGLDRYDPSQNVFTHYRYDQNISSTISNNNINVIFEDKEGYVWIGTDVGLNKFNKETGIFTRYTHDENNPQNSLSNNTVRAICEDSSDFLWIGTDDGLNKFDRDNNTFTIFKHEPGNVKSLGNNQIYSLYKDRSGNLWIGTNGGGLNKLIQQKKNGSLPTFLRYQHNSINPNSISNDQVYSIYEDSKGTFWIGTNGGGLNILDKETKIFNHYLRDPLNSSSISYNEIRAIYEDRSGLLWIGTYGGGINLVNRGRKEFIHYRNIPNNSNSLNENIVWSIYEDTSGLLWIGTHGGGLNKLDRTKNIFTHYLHDPNNPNSLSSNIVRLVFEDKSGNLWIGTHGGGLNKFDKKTGIFISYRYQANNLFSISHNELRSIYQDHLGTIWIGTNGGGLNKMIIEKGSGIPKFIRYRNDPNNPNSLSNDFIRVIYEDREGNLWIGTQGGGLNKLDREKEIFFHFRADNTIKNSLSNDYVFSIYEDTRGRLWLGTWGGGLNEFDRKSGTFKNYTMKEGLPSDAIYGMLEDGEGNLWMSTNNGISKFNPDKKTFRNYNIDDGLQNNEFNGGAFYKSGTSEMFFGGIGGFNSFYASNIKDNRHIPSIKITSFKKLNKEVIFNTPIGEITELELSYKDYLFSFEFASLDFNEPMKNQYAYKMEGLDENWIFTTADKRYAVYTTLSPGTYIFKVKGSNNDGIWNEAGTSIKIIILPPFWKTWWFILLCFLFAAGIIYVAFLRRMQHVRILTELQAAHEAQMSIMPQAEPIIESMDISALCIPAHEVGGDFFDYLWMNEEKTELGIVVGDVSGKGMKSAMTSTMCSGMISTLVYGTPYVSEIMARVNRSLFLKTEKKSFTALCFANINTQSHRFSFTNAGLNHPMLISGGKVSSLESSGPKFPLGMFSNTKYEERVIQLEPGDILLLFTDGITEAQNHTKEFFGESNLKNFLYTIDTSRLSAKEIKELIFENIKHFTSNTLQSDDMTLIVVKVL